MKTRTMSRMVAGALVMLALAVAAGGADADSGKKRAIKKGDLTKTAAPARLGTDDVRAPLQYPEDYTRRPLNVGQRSLWDWVQASLSTAPLL